MTAILLYLTRETFIAILKYCSSGPPLYCLHVAVFAPLDLPLEFPESKCQPFLVYVKYYFQLCFKSTTLGFKAPHQS